MTQNESTNLDLAGLLQMLRQRAPVIVLCCVLTGAAAFAFAKYEQKEYTATAQVLFRTQEQDEEAAGLPIVSSASPQPEQDTYLSLATLPRVAAETAARLGDGLTRTKVANSISVSQVTDTDLASISATWRSPSFAVKLADAYAQSVIADRQQTDANYYASALRAVRLQYDVLTPSQKIGAVAVDLKDREASLETLSQLQSSDVQLEQTAIPPTTPSSPRVLRDTAFGVVLGLLLGLVLAFVLQRFDRLLRDPAELERVYELPLLGVVPESPTFDQTRKRAPAAASAPPAEGQVFGLLRAHVRYFNVDRELRVVVVVSAGSGAGKTTIASNLAMASAVVGSRVLLLETDLRKPTVAKYLNLKQGPGLSEVLVHSQSLDDAVQRVDFGGHGDSDSRLDALVAGEVLPPNPPLVLESQIMQGIIAEAREKYDLVIIDTPPLALVPDAFPLVRQADGVLIVSRIGQDRTDVAARLRETLQSAGAPVIGVVANAYKQPRSGPIYGHGYYYRSDYSSQSDAQTNGNERAASNGSRTPKQETGARS
jgi:succinoglycan biosynthesis transport protein ExoP